MSAHTTQTELKFLGKLILEGELHCETGLHVGAGKGSLEIGGSDNPVVKDAFGRPYVPGSSLRGKLRSLLEQSSGLAVPSELVYLSKRKGQEVRIHQSDRPDDEICLLFGRNPGRMERVPAGARFKTRLVMDVLCPEDAPLFMRVMEGLRLLEDDTLGGGGSRGSGRVSFSKLRLVWRGKNHYATGAPEKEISAGATLAAIQTAVTASNFSFLNEE